MKKKKVKEWRNSLADPLMIQFTGLEKKNYKKFRKRLETDIEDIIGYYISLLSKKQRKALESELPVAPPLPGNLNITDTPQMVSQRILQ